MSQEESLRLVAEVRDRFTGPLGALKKQMESLAREGGVHTDTLSKGFGRLESSAQAAEKAISSGLKPALGMVGITGLSAAAAITGIAASMRSFAAGAASLGALSRETGQTADNLRNFGAVASKFGIDQEAVAAGTKNFAGQMREFGRGIGETYQWLNRQGRDAAGRQHFQEFAADLRNTTDRGEQLRKVLREMENIKDPTERGMFAEKFFGSADFGRLGDKHFGPILEMWKKTAQKLGPLDPAAVKSAEDFERTMSELRTSMQKLGTTVGQEVLPYASQFTTWLSDIVGGQRNDAIKAIRQGIGEIRKELDAIDWKGAGEQAKEFLTGTITFAGDLVKALKAAALLLGALKDLKDGNVGEAFKKLGQADKATDLGMGQGRAPGTIQDSMRADTGPMMLRQAEIQRQIAVLDENIARKESRPDPNGEGRVVDAEGRARRDRLIEETRKLSDEIRRLRERPETQKSPGDATAQPSAFNGGQFGGAKIQTASLGGHGGLGGAAQAGRVLGGGPPPGAAGVPGGSRGGSGDHLFGSGDGAGNPGASEAGRALRGEDGPTKDIPGALNPRLAGARKKFFDELDRDPILRERVMKTASLENGRSGTTMTHVIESMVNRGMMNGQTSFKQVLGIDENGNSLRNSRGKQTSFYGPIRHGGLHKPLSERHRRMGEEAIKAVRGGSNTIGYRTDQGMLTDPGARIYMAEGGDHSGHKVIGGENYFYMGRKGREWARRQEALDAARQNSATESAATDGGAAFSADFRRRQSEESERRSGLRLGPAAQGALQAGVGSGQGLTADGRVNIAIHTSDPATRVQTSASGDLFREIVQSRGRQMAVASEP